MIAFANISIELTGGIFNNSHIWLNIFVADKFFCCCWYFWYNFATKSQIWLYYSSLYDISNFQKCRVDAVWYSTISEIISSSVDINRWCIVSKKYPPVKLSLESLQHFNKWGFVCPREQAPPGSKRDSLERSWSLGWRKPNRNLAARDETSRFGW